MITIDGSKGEGGGQILRSALALSLVTGKPFRIDNIRAKRKKPGLLRQHLTAANAAVAVGRADVKGNTMGSTELVFAPKTVTPGTYRFAVGTAGSCTLVLQTILPALLTAVDESELVLEGGTHNPFAPPFDFLDQAFLPLVRRMGPYVTARLHRPGFYPAGGGKFVVTIKPSPYLARIDLSGRGEIIHHKALAVVAKLPRNIADREIKVIEERMGWGRDCFQVKEMDDTPGPGNIVSIALKSDTLTEVFTGFGQRGVPAETVALNAVKQAREYMTACVPVGRYLADQLLIPMALAGGGRYRTLPPTRHTFTNMEVVKRFLDVEILAAEVERGKWEVEVNA